MRLALFVMAALAASQVFADQSGQDTPASTEVARATYNYGMSLDIAEVIAVSEPSRPGSEPVPASITYLDHKGKRHVLEYLAVPADCVSP